MPYLAAIATKEWCFKEERVLNTMLLEFCFFLCQNVSLLWSTRDCETSLRRTRATRWLRHTHRAVHTAGRTM